MDGREPSPTASVQRPYAVPFITRLTASRFLPSQKPYAAPFFTRPTNPNQLRGSLAYVSLSSFLFRNSVPSVAGHGGPAFLRPLLRITYLCSRSCEHSEQFARVPTRRARFLYSKIRARPGERINEAKRNVSREERVAEHRRRLARRGAEWLHGVMRRFRARQLNHYLAHKSRNSQAKSKRRQRPIHQ